MSAAGSAAALTAQDLRARQIAADWHDGQRCVLYALASAGTIASEAPDLLTSLSLRRSVSAVQVHELDWLRDYCRVHGPRGPVAGWSSLRW